MNATKRGGRGMGSGQGRGGGRGRMGGSFALGPEGYCLCTQCGHREKHERGIPCMQKKCPSCGATMVRE
jgi:hypothetical protein